MYATTYEELDTELISYDEMATPLEVADPRQLKAEAKEAARQERVAAAAAKREAKLLARAQRNESREQDAADKARVRAEIAAAKAAERVDTYTAELEDTAAEELAVDAKQAAREARAEAKESARRERDEAKQAARRAKAAHRAENDDHIVEPPREPKVSWVQKRRQAAAARAQIAGGSGDEGVGGGRTAVSLIAGILGAIGLICSVILAVGALLVALGAGDGNAAYDAVSKVCDVLVGPLRDVFSFSGANSDMKEALVAWGAGSIGYLLVGIFAQSFLRSRLEDD